MTSPNCSITFLSKILHRRFSPGEILLCTRRKTLKQYIFFCRHAYIDSYLYKMKNYVPILMLKQFTSTGSRLIISIVVLQNINAMYMVYIYLRDTQLKILNHHIVLESTYLSNLYNLTKNHLKLLQHRVHKHRAYCLMGVL